MTNQFTFNYPISRNNDDGENKEDIEPGVSLTFGQISTKGVSNIIKDNTFKLNTAKVVCDFGMGYGLLILQLFEECTHISTIIGVEIHSGRYRIAIKHMHSFFEYYQKKKTHFNINIIEEKNKIILSITSDLTSGQRKLIMYCGSMFDYSVYMKIADVIVLNIGFSPILCKQLTNFVSDAKKNAIIISYKDFMNNNILNSNMATSVEHCCGVETTWSRYYKPYAYTIN